MALVLPVKLTVAIGKRSVPVDDVPDQRIAGPMKNLGREIGTKLATIKCPEHAKTATNVRVHVDAKGAADLKYDSCCEKLGAAIGAALG